MEQFQFNFQKAATETLPQDIKQLITASEEAAAHAYAPYSNFKVGAAVLLSDGTTRTGSNHENASYPAGICAERAVLSTLDMNPTAPKVKAIAVSYIGGAAAGKPAAPCGICRQTLLEVQLAQHSPIAVYLSGPNGQTILVDDASSLLPFYFSGDNL